MSGSSRWFLVLFLAAWAPVGCGDDHGHDDHGHDDHGHDDHGHDEHGHDDDGHDDDGDDDHGHGDHGHGEGVSITRFTDAVELFAEHPAAVVGEEVTLLVHLTILDGFSGPTEGSVTLTLDGPATLETTVPEPARPGIFPVTFRPETPGTYRGSLAVRLGPEGETVEDVVEGFEIEVFESDAAAEAASGEESEGGASIAFLKEQQWQVPFATTFAEERALVPTVEVSGEVTTPPGGSAELGAPIPGRVVAPASGLPRPGDEVVVGQVLATLAPAPSSPEEGARASLVVAEAEARAATARSTVERAERLVADRAIPERELEIARREAEVAGEAVAAARRAQRLFTSASTGRGPGTFRLTAPIAGILTDVHASPGHSVSAGDVLFQIVDPSELWIRARVPEHDVPRVRADDDASYRILGLDEWLPIQIRGESPAASVVTVGRTVARTSRTVDIIYALHSPDPRLRVGATVRVAVPAGESALAVTVPRSALVQDEGRDIVYIQTSGEAFEERLVRVGSRAGAWVALSSGVVAGDRVVTRGANLIRLAARASSEPGHGHVH